MKFLQDTFPRSLWCHKLHLPVLWCLGCCAPCRRAYGGWRKSNQLCCLQTIRKDASISVFHLQTIQISKHHVISIQKHVSHLGNLLPQTSFNPPLASGYPARVAGLLLEYVLPGSRLLPRHSVRGCICSPTILFIIFWNFMPFLSIYFKTSIFMKFLLIFPDGFSKMPCFTRKRDSTPPPLCGLGIVKNDPPGWIYHCSSQPTNAITFQQPEQRVKDVKSEISWGWFFRYTVSYVKLHSQLLNNISVFQLKSRFNWHRSRNQQCFSTNSSYQTHIKKIAVSKALFKTIAKNSLRLFYRSIFP